MIDIIKPPTKQYLEKISRKHFRCRHCGTEWLADSADYRCVSAEVWVNDVEQEDYIINCPICGWQLYFHYYEEGKTWESIPYNQIEVKNFI